MAEKNNLKEKKSDQSEQDNPVNFSSMNGDDIVSLSDEELDNILNTAEISDTPIADIDIDLDEGDEVVISETAMEQAPVEESAAPAEEPIAPAAAVELPSEEPLAMESAETETLSAVISEEEETVVPGASLVSEPELSAEEAGFFTEADEDETISISPGDLDSILEDTSAGPAVPASPEASVLDGEELLLDTTPREEEGERVMEDTPLSPAFESVEEPVDDDILVLDDEELIIDHEESLATEELPLKAEEAPGGVEDSGIEEVSAAVEGPEAAPVAETVSQFEETAVSDAAADLKEEDNPIITVSGSDLDDMVSAADEVSEPSAVEEPAVAQEKEPALEEFALKEDVPPAVEEPVSEMETRAQGSALNDIPLIDEEEILITEEDLAMPMDFPMEQEAPAPAVEEELVMEEVPVPEVAPAKPDFQREAATSLMSEEEEVLMLQEEEPADELSFEEIPLSEPVASGPVPVVEAAALGEEEPMESIDDELVFTEEEKIPTAAASEPTAELISDSDISEMEREAAVEPQPLAPVELEAAPVPEGESMQGLSEDTKKDIKKVLGYLDGLFDDLPEARVKEFANSEYYDIYNKLFKELGL